MRSSSSFRPQAEGLESRNLLATSVLLQEGILYFYSDDSGDNSSVEVDYFNLEGQETKLLAFTEHGVTSFDPDDVQLIVFYTSSNGQDRFINNTDKKAIGFLFGEENVFVGGTSTDSVYDYSVNSYLESNSGNLDYYDMEPNN